VLRGRRNECRTLDQLLERVRAGRSEALVLRGEPGVGKTALLDYLIGQASGCRVERAAGVQSEMELPFAGLHQLCAPMLDRLDRIPGPQQAALGTAFGLHAGPPPDRFLIGLAALSLLSEVAEQRPLVCVVDDAQWLDRASAQALAFVARRLLAESVVVVFAARSGNEDPELTGLPELEVAGLRDGDARVLLASALRGPLDERVRDRIVAETRGNPLALLELPRGLTPAQLAGFGPPNAPTLPGRIEDSFQRRLEALPGDTKRLLLVAAAEPVGEPLLVWRAAERLEIGTDAAAPAAAAGLAEIGTRVRFRHPLVRSAIYRAASVEERQIAHHALAHATDPQVDPDRRAWHRAQAANRPDEDVAAELERSAGRAQARGGLAAAAAFLEQAAGLTPDPGRRAERALAAAQAQHQAGAPDAALALLGTVQAGPLDELRRAQVALLRGQIAFAVNRGSDAPPLLLEAAQQLEPLDVGLARETYLDALLAAMFAGSLTAGGLLKVAAAARAATRPSGPPRAPDLLMDGLALRITEGYRAGVPILKRALSAFGSEQLSREQWIRWHWLACHTAHDLWDDETWDALATRHVRIARDRGLLSELPLALIARLYMHLYAGELTTAASVAEEVEAVIEATGGQLAPYGALELAALQGREADFAELTAARMTDVMARGEGMGLTLIQNATALLYNGLGRYEEALAAARQSEEHIEELGTSTWALPELIEAATRSGSAELAADAFERLSETTRASGTDWALGIEARSRALLSEDDKVEALYREAIDRLGRTRVRVELARAHLLYGEWLRRERRRLDAREQLRTAHEMLAAMGAAGFAQRAARELGATGETARRRTVETRGQLTAQEAQIARLARDGLSNPEIGARLFISPRTVEYHLHKVFTKLDIGSRSQLDGALPSEQREPQPA
jgi:DNA-binding CsgD family transcriptional regulator